MKTYSKEELEEFKKIILNKIARAQEEYNALSKHLQDNSTKDTDPVWMNADYVNEIASIEEINQSTGRQKKFIDALWAALGRVENGTYGICTKTGKLIPKGRLMAVPHTTQSIDAKENNHRSN
jgi:DnaK suppressor protein